LLTAAWTAIVAVAMLGIAATEVVALLGMDSIRLELRFT
jgi:hypothetical protein